MEILAKIWQLAPQIVPIPLRHCRFAAEFRRDLLYTCVKTTLMGAAAQNGAPSKRQ
jgi:hypothetical protein